MKALKEKRISLRSLWRMGLVVLSVFALAFAACGGSDSADNTSPGAGGELPPSRVVTRVSISKLPYERQQGGPAYEGLPINLAGTELRVQYADQSYATVTDISRMTVFPSRIYDSGYNNYYIVYREGGVDTFSGAFNVPDIRMLLDLDWTGDLGVKTYNVDDKPDFVTGSTFVLNGVYTTSKQLNDGYIAAGYRFPFNTPADWRTQATFDHKYIPFDPDKYTEYRWAWVENVAPSPSPEWEFVDDDPGILISIGQYGYIDSKIIADPNTAQNANFLSGARIKIDRLYKVKKLAWKTPVNFDDIKIFFDDPLLIGNGLNDGSRNYSKDDFDLRMDTWIDKVFAGTEITVTYTSGDTRDLTVKEMREWTRIYATGNGNNIQQNRGIGGNWANLELFPISYAKKRIDVTRDNKAIVDSDITVDFDWIETWANNDDYIDAPFAEEGGANITRAVGDGGWAQWAQLANGRSAIRFYWRGEILDTPIRIYNRPASMTLTVKPGVPTETTSNRGLGVVMNGFNSVYSGVPEGYEAFLRKYTIAVTYAINGLTSQTATRDDLQAAMDEGRCRDRIIFYDSETSAKIVTPSLYSENIFNWYDDRIAPVSGDFEKARSWTAFSNGSWNTATTGDIKRTSALTLENSYNFTNRTRGVAARITYVGWAGNPENYRQARADAVVAVKNYVKDPPSDDPNAADYER